MPEHDCPVLARIRARHPPRPALDRKTGKVKLKPGPHIERGLAVRIADALGITREAVWNWRRVPAEHVLTVEKLLGIPRHRIRPDLYPPPQHGGRNGKSRRQQQFV